MSKVFCPFKNKSLWSTAHWEPLTFSFPQKEMEYHLISLGVTCGQQFGPLAFIGLQDSVIHHKTWQL